MAQVQWTQLARKTRRLHCELIEVPHGAWLASKGLHTGWRVWVWASSKNSELGTGWARAKHLRFLIARLITEYKLLGRGSCVHPHLQDCKLQNSRARLKKPLLGAYLQRKGRESPKEPFMNFYQILCWLLLRPYSAENSRAERLEIGTARSILGPVLPWLSHRAAISAKQERAAFFKDWSLAWNKELINQKLYIIGNNLGQTKMCGTGTGEHTHHLPWKLRSTSWGGGGVTQGSHPPDCTRGPLWRQVEVVNVVLSDIRRTTPGLVLIKSRQGKTARTNQAWWRQQQTMDHL